MRCLYLDMTLDTFRRVLPTEIIRLVNFTPFRIRLGVKPLANPTNFSADDWLRGIPAIEHRLMSCVASTRDVFYLDSFSILLVRDSTTNLAMLSNPPLPPFPPAAFHMFNGLPMSPKAVLFLLPLPFYPPKLSTINYPTNSQSPLLLAYKSHPLHSYVKFHVSKSSSSIIHQSIYQSLP